MPINFDFFQVKTRPEVTAEDLAALDPAKLEHFKTVLADELVRDLISDKLTAQQIATKTMAFAYDKARLHLLHVQPHKSVAEMELAERRRAALPVQERMRLSRLPVPPEIVAAIEAAAASNAAFEQAKTELRQLRADLSDARAKLANDIMSFQKLFTPQSPGELIKAHLAAELQRRKDGSNASQAVQPQVLCQLDASMSVRGGSRRGHRHPDGAAAGRTYPQSMFGQRVAVPVVPTVKPWMTKKLGTA